ncbi:MULTISPECIES: GP88 family protein [Clostridia]|uniref:GP88 family protein n=1 Tax=Clostridia TaxID=186801 RepID=UPI002A8D7820|nr:hypothetical protein [Peptostreptococcus porci]MDY5098755.1 hypothetical protein [Clostridium sp.]MDY5437420.1 hypothetical protein [Peptostreptococcus porci]
MKKTELNQNICLSERNTKSAETDDTMFLTWSLPSKITCPYATELCSKKCFAKKNESFKRTRESRSKNLTETYKDTFVADMIKHFEYHLQRPKAQDKLIIVRIHTSGDFYNFEYFLKWVDIAEHFKNNKNILFQAYTKSMPILNQYKDIENINIHLVWSIWHDTPVEYNNLACKMNLQTFTALPKDEIDLAVKNGAFLCNGNCGDCKECYTGKSKQIVIPYH